MATFSATANVVEWTSVDDPRVVFRFVASEVAGPGGTSDHGALTGLGDDDHTGYALADGTRGAFATAAQGALADTALQLGPLRVADVVSDGSTVTTLTATDGVLDVDVVRVLNSDPPGARGTCIVPHPSEWPDQSLLLVGDDFGASFGYWDPDGPTHVAATGVADLTLNLDGGSDVTLDDCSLEYSAWSPSPGDSAIAGWNASTTGNVTGVAIKNLAVNGSPVDTQIGIALTDLTGTLLDGGTAAAAWGVEFDNGDVHLWLDTPNDPADTRVIIYVYSIGGGFVAPTSITFDSVHFIEAGGAYLGFASTTQGIGELNPADPFGPYTHTWFDNADIPGKSLHVFSDGARLWAEHVPGRWEWLMGYTPPISGPLDGLTNVQQVVAAANQALVDQSTADGISVGALDGNLVAVSEGTVEDVVQAVDDLALGGTPDAHAASHEDGGADELALDASQITTGTVDTARLGSGTASSSTFLRGDQTWATPAWTVISDTTLGSNQASVSFTDLGSYALLELMMVARSTMVSFGYAQGQLRFNSDTGANYNWARSGFFVFNGNYSANNGAANGATLIDLGRVPGSQVNTDRRGLIRLTIQSIGAFRPTVQSFGVENDPTNEATVGAVVIGVRTVAEDVTSMQLSLSSGDFAAGSRFVLLGRT